MFKQKRRYLIMDELDVLTVLTAINNHHTFFSNRFKLVGNCGWENEPSKWFVGFDASDKRWSKIAAELSNIGKITVKVNPGGATDLYFTKD